MAYTSLSMCVGRSNLKGQTSKQEMSIPTIHCGKPSRSQISNLETYKRAKFCSIGRHSIVVH